ncbi:hypothetical protein [uncultured Dokdonia sp.]|uniref:hypothetical protein n=1 Tax=uncultured Dokdonia sp. TaxID=575653 RepID=UPI0026053861|nr:hypothetical protein [uncultured Dokdonia sp.]
MEEEEIIDTFKTKMKEQPGLFEAIFFLSEFSVKKALLEEMGHLKMIPLKKYDTESFPVDSKYSKSISRCFK